MSDSRKKRAEVIQDSIRQILYHDWNPIGFFGLLPEDEYDSYIAPVYRILIGTRSDQDLIDLLFRTERDLMGMVGKSPELLHPVVRKLLDLDVRL